MKGRLSNQLISITSWNINGLEHKSHGLKCNKLNDPEVVNSLKWSDLIGLLETHADKSVDISLPGYYVIRKDRPKHQNARKPSGGIAVLLKSSLRHMFKFDPVSDSDIFAVRMLKEFISLKNDLFLAFVYLPPLNSTYGKVHSKHIMSKLEKQIEYFACKGKILISGDLNARIGDCIDLIQKKEDPCIPTPHDDTFDIILPRVSQDNSVVNQSGRWLIEQCVDNQLYVLNGRTVGDLKGQFTCHTPRGSSTVDYFIASRSVSNFTQSMKVHDFSFLSDHSMLTAKFLLASNSCHDENICSVDTFECLAPDRFVWSERSKIKFQDVFSSSSIKEK